ncbi:hypothetical protein BDN67DRAFT_815241 [Paxillus ammoniavirescens]|nr:hypothetical protein BDN67DRAFT_815241 [Paxillus ammoniavirescens]
MALKVNKGQTSCYNKRSFVSHRARRFMECYELDLLSMNHAWNHASCSWSYLKQASAVMVVAVCTAVCSTRPIALSLKWTHFALPSSLPWVRYLEESLRGSAAPSSSL